MVRKETEWRWSEGTYGVKIFDGKPCVRCGSTERLLSTRRCRACNQRYLRQNLNASTERNAMRGKPCAVCADPMQQPCYDEIDGVFRGWVCHSCNLAMGHLRHDPARARKLWRYLVRVSR